MKIKSLASLALLTTAPMVTAQPIIKQSEEDLKKNCNSVNDFIKEIMENKNNPYYEANKQRITNIKNSALPTRCKTDTMIRDSYVGTMHEGRACYVKDKLEKAKNGGIANIEKNRLRPEFITLFKSKSILELYTINNREGIFIVISPKHASKESKTIFDAFKKNQSNQDFAFISFVLGDKEVPDFHRSLFSLQNRKYLDKIPAEIMNTAISSDAKLLEKEKKHLIEALEIKDNDKYITISDEYLKNAIKKTLESITDDCVNKDNGVMVKGLSLTKSSTYELQKWDITPLKEWVADKIKDEL